MPESPNEEHELPAVEAVLAGTLALMTGYSQALLAELHPEHRVLMGRKIGNNLALLAEHPQLSSPFQAMLAGLQRRWAQMAGCTAEAELACHASPCQGSARPSASPPNVGLPCVGLRVGCRCRSTCNGTPAGARATARRGL